jgi:hypothetical protein
VTGQTSSAEVGPSALFAGPGEQLADRRSGSPEEFARSGAADGAPEAVVAALSGLDGLDELVTSEHVERFDAVHTALTAALTGTEGTASADDGVGSGLRNVS